MDFDIVESTGDNFYQWQGYWAQKTVEHEHWDDDINDFEGMEWLQWDTPRGFKLGTYDSPASLTALRYQSGQDDYAGPYPQHPNYWDNNESILNSDIVLWNNTERRLADGSSNCYTTSMVPGPFTRPYNW